MTAHTQSSLHGETARYEGGIHQVADGCLAYLQPNGGLGESNVGLIIGDDATLVIDTCWDQNQARRMLDAAAPWIAGKPITTVINTHSNGDHWWGNAAMPPDATIITSDASRAAMGRENRLAIAAFTTALDIGAKLPLPHPLRRSLQVARTEFAPFDFWGIRIRYPNRTFTGAMTLTVGDHTLDLVEVGPAHTPGDLMVFDRERRVVYAGDILFIGQTPVMWDGPADNWIAALQMIIDFEPAAIVPGHGPLASIDQVGELLSYFQWMDSVATAMSAAGIPPKVATLNMLNSRNFTSSPWANWGRPELLFAGVQATYRQRAREHREVSQLQMLATMRGIQSIADTIGTNR
ncbi:MBL fold metallo-hydrolase [Nocardia vaccinii]|uniref:MBL fold metallo-hydrolase n=1 Tax=Nocardia vaccinii TaxID=1822 RepID=UPI000834B28E|nr:MBL fold metallo-hydrolase [Nocardia vaccinii]